MNNRNISFGILLVSIGIIWVLVNSGVINWSIANSLLTLWPLILIAIGINIIFKNNEIVKIVVWLILLAIVVIHGYYNSRTNTTENYTAQRNISIPKEAAARDCELALSLGGIKLDMDSKTSNLLDATINDPNLKYTTSYANGKQSVKVYNDKPVYFRIPDAGKEYYCTLHLNRDVVWEMDVKAGAVNGTMDMKDLKIKDVDIDVGAGNLTLILGNSYDNTNVKIDAGASKIDLVIPYDVGVKIKVDGVLSRENLDSLGWERKDDYYVSPDFESVQKKIFADIDMGVGKLSVVKER